MHQNFVRAILVFVWQSPQVNSERLIPSYFFEGEGTVGVLADGVVFRSGIHLGTSLPDEIIISPTRLTIACFDPAKILEFFNKVWDLFHEEKPTMIAAGYNAELEWLDLGKEASLWIADNFLNATRRGDNSWNCFGISLAMSGDQVPSSSPCRVTIEPRVGKSDAIFAAATQHFDQVPTEISDFVSGIIRFAREIAPATISQFFPPQ